MNITIDGLHDQNNKDIAKYINKKIGALEKYMPRHARLSAHANVVIKEVLVKTKKECWVEVNIQLPSEMLSAKESTMNMFAAVDIVEEKLKVQLRKYKDKHSVTHRNPLRRILQRIRPSQE
jgi:putative sigma-54 modulation protein